VSRFSRSRGTRRSRTGFRPATDWLFASVAGVLTAGVGGTDADVWNLSLLATEDLDNDPETVRRMRGRVHLISINPSEVQTTHVAVGIGVAPPEAIAAGIGAVPLPYSDAHWDGWMWIDFYPFSGDGPRPLNQLTPNVIDSRAQRRLEDNHLYLALEMATTAGVVTNVGYQVDLRWLQSESSR